MYISACCCSSSGVKLLHATLALMLLSQYPQSISTYQCQLLHIQIQFNCVILLITRTPSQSNTNTETLTSVRCEKMTKFTSLKKDQTKQPPISNTMTKGKRQNNRSSKRINCIFCCKALDLWLDMVQFVV